MLLLVVVVVVVVVVVSVEGGKISLCLVPLIARLRRPQTSCR